MRFLADLLFLGLVILSRLSFADQEDLKTRPNINPEEISKIFPRGMDLKIFEKEIEKYSVTKMDCSSWGKLPEIEFSQDRLCFSGSVETYSARHHYLIDAIYEDKKIISVSVVWGLSDMSTVY